MPQDESARTMRIDIHPDFFGESLARKKQEATFLGHSPDSTSVVARARSWRMSGDYERLLQSIYDGVLITDLKGRILDFNDRAVDFFLCTEADLYGRQVIGLISGADESLMDAIRRNLENHRHTLIEAHCVRRDKTMFPAEIAVNRIDLDGEGQLCFFIRDITVRKKEQAALEAAIAKLEKHDRARTMFVSNVSHELRTPLTSMIYAVNNLLKGVCGPIPERVRRYLEILDGDSRRLLNTVNDILDLRKIESNTLTLARTRIPIGRLVKRSVDSLMMQADRKMLKLSVMGGNGNWFVDCDPLKMERVIINVVGNAIKFTPEGGVVDVVVDDHPHRPGYVRVICVDNGIGIPAEALPRVTERYFTVGEQPSGCGLGLAISKEIVEMHGGTISIASPPPGCEKGTAVTISLPTAPPPTILLVDDDRSVLLLLQEQVRARGYCVITAESGTEALEKIRLSRPDLVVLDLVLPGMDGTEVVLQMRGDKELARIPVIVITGAGVSRARAEILAGFSIPAISKPWHDEDLLDKMESAFLGASALSRL